MELRDLNVSADDWSISLCDDTTTKGKVRSKVYICVLFFPSATTKETDMAKMSEAERGGGGKEPCTWLSVDDCSPESRQKMEAVVRVLCRETEHPETEMTLC